MATGFNERKIMSDWLIKSFETKKLPARLQRLSERFQLLAQNLYEKLPDGAERSEALRSLLDARNAALLAMLADESVTMQEMPEYVVCRVKNTNMLCTKENGIIFEGDYAYEGYFQPQSVLPVQADHLIVQEVI